MTPLPGQQGPWHTNSITALAFSHDSKLLVTGSDDWTIRIWDLESRTQRTVIPLPADTNIYDVAFLADNRRLLIVTLWELYFWSEESGLTQKFTDDGRRWFYQALPDGCIACRNDYSLSMLQFDGENISEKVLGQYPNINGAATSNNGRLIAIFANDTLTLIDLESNSILWVIDKITSATNNSIIFSSDDSRLAISNGVSKPWIIDVVTGIPLKPIEPDDTHYGHWYDKIVSFILNDQFLTTVGGGDFIRFWDIQNDKFTTTPTGTGNFTTTLTPYEGFPGPKMAAHEGWIRAINLNPDQTLLASAGTDGLIKLWSMKSGTLTAEMGRRVNELVGVEFTHDGNHIVAGYKDSSIRLWSIAENRLVKTCQAHEGPLTSMAVTNRGVVTSSGTDVIKIWNISDFKLKSVIGNPDTYFINKLAAPHEGDTIAFACWSEVDGHRSGHVIIWDLVAERPLSIPDNWDDVPFGTCGHGWSIKAMAMSPDGTILATSVREQIQIWDTRSGRLMTQLREEHKINNEPFTTLAFSRDGKQLAAGTYGIDVTLWNTAEWTQAKKLRNPADSFSNLAFSTDGKTLAVATHYEENVNIHDLSSHTTTRLLGHTGFVQSISFSPDGSLLATGGRDGIVVVWKNGEMLTSFAIE